MPFDFASYKAKCDSLSTEELQLEWQNYTRQLTTGATMTASSVMLSPLTSGISLIGLGISVPQLHNARKKRNIVGNKMHSYGTEPHTRRRDIIIPSAISLTTAGLTYGLTPSVAEIIGAEAGSKGIEYLVSHATLDALWYILDEAQSICHHRRSKRKLKRLQQKQKQHLAQVAKMGEYPQIGLDVKKPIFEESRPSSIRAESLRAYYLGDNESYDEPDTPPPYYPKKYVYEGGQVKVAYNSRPNSYLEPLNRRNSQLSTRRLNYTNSGFPSDDKSYLHSTTASKKSWTSEHYRRSLSRPVTPSSPAMMEPVPYLQTEEESEEDYDLESESEEENESDEEEDEEEDEEDEEDVEEEKIRDKDVIEHTLTLEQEVAMLKATILRMEMERRGLVSSTENLGNPNQVQGKVSPVSPGITVKSTESAKNKSGSPSTGSAILSKITRKLGTDQSLARQPVEIAPTNAQSRSLQASTALVTQLSEQSYNDLKSSRMQTQHRPAQKRYDSGYFASNTPNHSSCTSRVSTPGVISSNDDEPTRYNNNNTSTKTPTPPMVPIPPTKNLEGDIGSYSPLGSGLLIPSMKSANSTPPSPSDSGRFDYSYKLVRSRNSSPARSNNRSLNTNSEMRFRRSRSQARQPILNLSSDEYDTRAGSGNELADDLDSRLGFKPQMSSPINGLTSSVPRVASSVATSKSKLTTSATVFTNATRNQRGVPTPVRSWRAPV